MRHLSKLNTALLVAILLVNLYVILTPVLPTIALLLPGAQDRRQVLSAKVSQAKTEPVVTTPMPNSVLIPAMMLEKPILEGRDTYKVLNQGILRWPSSSTPDKGSNTVLLAHRFTYKEPQGMFYYLDKLKAGDEIGLVWNNIRYTYRVSDVGVVKPAETSILEATDSPRLTLYTCTTLLWPKDRLVVTADQIWPLPETLKSKETSDE